MALIAHKIHPRVSLEMLSPGDVMLAVEAMVAGGEVCEVRERKE